MNENEFTYKGKTYKAVPAYGDGDCRGCILFYDLSIDCTKLLDKGICPSCWSDKRQDGKEIIFITSV